LRKLAIAAVATLAIAGITTAVAVAAGQEPTPTGRPEVVQSPTGGEQGGAGRSQASPALEQDAPDQEHDTSRQSEAPEHQDGADEEKGANDQSEASEHQKGSPTESSEHHG